MFGTQVIEALLLPALIAMVKVGSGKGEEASPKEPFLYNVTDFGAKGDGVTDDTAAFQAALDAAGAARGGIVFAPAGRYLIGGHLRVPMDVTLRGTFEAPPAHAGIRDRGLPKPEYGTVLLAVGGKGSEDGPPFIALDQNSTLRGMVIYYPEQDPGRVPTPYPWCIRMRGNNPAVLDCELLNPYNAIDARNAHRHLIRNIHGQPLRRGILVSEVYDIGRIENVHWNPWWSMKPELFNWQLENGEAFIFGRTDWQYVHNTFCFGYKIGYRFIRSEQGSCNGNFLGIGADDCLVAIQIESAQPMGLLITNGEFVSFMGPNPTMVVVTEQFREIVRFVNCAYWGSNKQIARISGSGLVSFSDCNFRDFDRDHEGRAAIQAESGDLIVRGCHFSSDAPQVWLGKGVRRAVITDNLVRGKVRIINESSGRVEIRGNIGTE